MSDADLWTRVQDFCDERGWHAELYVREDEGPNFGRVGVRVIQGGGYSFRSFGRTTNQALRGIALQLERDGFDSLSLNSEQEAHDGPHEAPRTP